MSSKLEQKQETTPAEQENKHLSKKKKKNEETVSFYIMASVDASFPVLSKLEAILH